MWLDIVLVSSHSLDKWDGADSRWGPGADSWDLPTTPHWIG